MRKLIFSITLLSLTLQGCVPLVVAAAAGTGAIVVVKRDDIKKHFSDSEIKFSINNKIYGDKALYGDNHITVVVYQSEVLLVGQVRNEDYHQQVLQLVKDTAGVTRIYDQLTINAPTSFNRQTTDSMITTKVKTKILANVGIGFVVTTEEGIVYLMGNITRERAEKATEITRTTDGVTKVITIFNYIAPVASS